MPMGSRHCLARQMPAEAEVAASWYWLMVRGDSLPAIMMFQGEPPSRIPVPVETDRYGSIPTGLLLQ